MYLATLDCATANPSLSNSPWIRGAPHSGFSMLIRRIFLFLCRQHLDREFPEVPLCGVDHRQNRRCRATMIGRGFHETRYVRAGTNSKACLGVPSPRGRLYAVGRGERKPQAAIAFPSHGTYLVHLGGSGTERDCCPGTCRR